MWWLSAVLFGALDAGPFAAVLDVVLQRVKRGDDNGDAAVGKGRRQHEEDALTGPSRHDYKDAQLALEDSFEGVLLFAAQLSSFIPYKGAEG